MEGLAMKRSGILAIVPFLVLSASAAAQGVPWQFRWQQGQVLTYRVEHQTAVAEVANGSKSDTKTKLNLSKRWQVLAVDAAGVATVQLSMVAMRLEMTKPNGDTLLFDSTDVEKSSPPLREGLAQFVGQPLAVLRIDTRGKVVEVKESKHGPASRFESDLPFVVTLPEENAQAGLQWERAYKVTIEPPQGTGEKYEAVQKYLCKTLGEGTATLTLSTAFKTMPESLLDRVPLLQMQPEGEVVFDTLNGRLNSASLHIEKELLGHQGEGSSYKFQSLYTEKFVDGQ
jgi:hypothetical protein